MLVACARADCVEKQEGDVQHNTANRKATLGLHAIAPDLRILHDIAVPGDIPRRAGVATLRVDGVGRGLDVDSVGPDDKEGHVEQDGEDGEEDV